MRKRRIRLIDTIILGVVGALSAQAFMVMLRFAQKVLLEGIAGYHPPALASEGGALEQVIGAHWLWLVPVVTTLGGLVSGLLVYSLAPEAEGHGTDTAVKAFHRSGGFIRARVAPLKAVASAITIGSGGAAGREGPTALISAGVGSIFGTLLHRTEAERRLLVLIGMAAGLAAIFRSPIGTAVFAVEVLYSEMEFDAGALLHTMLASVLAYAVNGLFVGYEPLFTVPHLTPPSFTEYGFYILLGLIAGAVATLVPVTFYGLRDLFRRLPVPPHLKPAIGGLGLGLLALAVPQVLGGGYGWIQQAIDGKLAAGLLLALAFAKLAAFALTVSSGGSGGVFAPSLYVGAMLGGFVAVTLHLPAAPFVVVGMAAVFGGAARVPFATLLMVTEMTGGYTVLVPAALAVFLSSMVQHAFSSKLRYHSLYEAQVVGASYSPAHHVDHMVAALRLLREHPVFAPETVGHLDLQGLLESGVPVDLPERRQLLLERLAESSDCVGKPIARGCPTGGHPDVELVAVLRAGTLLFPDEPQPFAAGDELLLISSPAGREVLAPHLAPRLPQRTRRGSDRLT